MPVFYFTFTPAYYRKVSVFFLAFISCVGFAYGIYTANASGDVFFSMMRMAAASRVSIVSLAFSVLLPFLFTAFAVIIKKSYLFLPVCFLKTFAYAFCMYGICQEFGSAGWLACGLLQFTDTFVLLVLLWFWIRHTVLFRRTASKELTVCAAICFGIGLIDFFIISPFLVMLINY